MSHTLTLLLGLYLGGVVFVMAGKHYYHDGTPMSPIDMLHSALTWPLWAFDFGGSND